MKGHPATCNGTCLGNLVWLITLERARLSSCFCRLPSSWAGLWTLLALFFFRLLPRFSSWERKLPLLYATVLFRDFQSLKGPSLELQSWPIWVEEWRRGSTFATPSSGSTGQSVPLPAWWIVPSQDSREGSLCHRGGKRDRLRHLQSAWHGSITSVGWPRTSGKEGVGRLREADKGLSWVGLQVKKSHAWHSLAYIGLWSESGKWNRSGRSTF